jgi:hypothetical protein
MSKPSEIRNRRRALLGRTEALRLICLDERCGECGHSVPNLAGRLAPPAPSTAVGLVAEGAERTSRDLGLLE